MSDKNQNVEMRIQALEAERNAVNARRASIEQELTNLRGLGHQEQAGMEEALSMFEQIIESTDDGIMIEDERGRVSFVNSGLIRMLGYESKKDILNRTWPEFFSLEQEKKILGRPGMFESLLVTRHKTKIPILITSTSFYFQGAYRGVLSMIKDITAQKSAEQALLRSEKYTAIAQLSMGISHEIKNPLSVLQAHMDLLKSNKPFVAALTEKQKYSIDVIKTQAERIAATVQSLSNLAHDRAPDIRPVNLVRIVEDTSDMFFPKLKKAGITLHRTYDKHTAMTVYADEGKLIQVLTNLYFNALESMASGGSITVALVQNASHETALSITDTGCGIPEEILGRIRDPFFTTKPQGTGMGLAVCARIIEDHHGRISFESRPGRGTRVTVHLPEKQPVS